MDTGLSAAVELHPEKRFATFVKCDLVDSTRWSTALPLEDQRLLSKAFRTAVADVAKKQSGHVMRYEGDGALVSFGHPVPREDATECAVRAGLAIVQAVGSINVVTGVALQVRVGIASGEVAVGDAIVDGDRIEYAVDGPVPAMAERLRAVGKPGQVVVSHATRRLCGRFFAYVDLGVIAAKGFDDGLRAWWVVAETEVESSFEARRLDDVDSAIVGREAERRAIAEAWADARAGQGHVLVLTGEPGIGKSRLGHEGLRMAQADGAMVLRVDCTPRTSRTPLFPIGVLLRRMAGVDTAADTEEKVRRANALLDGALGGVAARAVWPFLAPLFGIAGVALPDELMPHEVRDRTVAANVELLSAVAARQPVFILCEDLHWVDATTLLVLEQVARQVTEMPCLLLVTSRSIAEESLRWLAQYPKFELQPLSHVDATELVRFVSPTADASVVSLLVARAAGTPLWIIEFASEVELAGRDGRAPSLDSVPASLKLVVQSRLGRWPELKPIVQAAAVLGREFPVELLERVLNQRRDEVVPTLQLLGRHGIFLPADDRQFERAEFRHAMIRDAVYDTLLRDDRWRWHSRAADEIAALQTGSSDASAEALAHHLEEAQRFLEAGQLHLGAATETAARGAFVESVAHCDAALRQLDRLGPNAEPAHLRVAALVQRAVALIGQHGFGTPVVEAAYELAAAHAGPGTPDVLLYAIARGRAGLRLIRGQLHDAHKFAAEGMTISERSSSAAHQLDALSMRLYTTLYAGTLDECARLVDVFMALYAAADGDTLHYPAPQNAKTAMLTLIPTIAWLRGDPLGAEQAISDGLAHVDRLRRPYDQAMLHAWIAGTRCTQRRFGEALRHAVTAIDIAEARGYKEWVDTGRLLALLSQMALTPTPELIGTARAVLTQLDAQAVGLNASWYRWLVAHCCHAIADYSQAQQVLEEARSKAQSSCDRRLDAELLLLEARLPHNGARAAALLDSALVSAHVLGDVVTALRVAAMRAMADDSSSTETVEFAASVLHRLNSGGVDPADPYWMRRSMEALTVPAVGKGPPPSRGALHSPVGSLRPLQIGNFEGDFRGPARPMSDGGQATYSGYIFTALLKRAVVEDVIPKGYVLAERTDKGDDHPVVVMLGTQANCSLVNGGTATPAPLDDYNELIVLVPFVVKANSTEKLWHNFSVAMFLDKVSPIVLGNVPFQYYKLLGDFSSTAVAGFPGEEVYDETGALAFSCGIAAESSRVRASSALPGFADFLEIMKMPILGVLDASLPPTCSYFEWDDSLAEVGGVSAFFQFSTAYRPAMGRWVQTGNDFTYPDAQASFFVADIRWRLSHHLPKCDF